ncbi:Uncharacterised protein [Raoultella terrigena]|uniref:Uncharacterized protein n=1 Tax=Raoultella terrigena TaxID=577 RepID=A0A4U9CVX5_RAOTE|nr:Uncharacterised protein [Raoultella terrigena]
MFVWAYSCASALLWVPFSLILIVEGQQELDWRLAVGAVISSALHIAYSLILQGWLRARRTGCCLSDCPRKWTSSDDTVCNPSHGRTAFTRRFTRRLYRYRWYFRCHRQYVQERKPAATGNALGGSDRHRHRWLYTLGRLFGNLSAPGSSELLRQHTPATESDSYPWCDAATKSHSNCCTCGYHPNPYHCCMLSPCLHPCTDSHAEHATGTRRSSQGNIHYCRLSSFVLAVS